jgi:hypothetical protein
MSEQIVVRRKQNILSDNRLIERKVRIRFGLHFISKYLTTVCNANKVNIFFSEL